MFRPLIASATRFGSSATSWRSCWPRRAEASVDAAELVAVDYEPLPAVTDPARRRRTRSCCIPDVGTNICLHRPPEPDPRPVRRDATSSSRAQVISQRLAALPDRAALDSPPSSARTGGSTLWISLPDAAPGQDGARDAARARAENVRVVAPDVGGGFGAKGLDVEDVLVGWMARAHRQTRALDRDAQREHGRDAPRPGDGDRLRARRRRATARYRRCGSTSSPTPAPIPALGAFLPNLTAMMSSGVYAIPQDRDRGQLGRDEHHPDRPGARRRPTRGHPDARACDRHARRRARAGSGRGAPAELHPATTPSRTRPPPAPTTTSATTVARSTSRSSSAGYDELRREQASRRRENGSPHQLGIGLSALRRDHQRDLRERVRRGRDHRRRRGDRAHRLVLAGPGPRDDVRADRRRAARAPDREDHRASRATPTSSPAAPARTGRSRPRSAAWPPAQAGRRGGREGASGSPPTSSRPAPRTWCSTSSQGRFHVTGAPEPALSWGDLAVAAGRRGPAGRAERRGRLQGVAADVPVRRARRGRRGRHRDRRGRAQAHGRRRRRRADHQPAGRRGTGARRRRRRHRAGAVRGAHLRRATATP